MDSFFTIRLPALGTLGKEREEEAVAPPSATTEPTDESLLASISGGDKEALASLFRRYARIVRGLAYRILRDATEADDLLQDIFVLIHKNAHSFDGSKSPARSWLLQITYRRAISRRRYLQSRHHYDAIAVDEIAAEFSGRLFGDVILESLDHKRTLQQAFCELPANQQRTLELYFFQGYTLSEIAAELGQTLGNVRNHYYRGLDKLRQALFSKRAIPQRSMISNSRGQNTGCIVAKRNP